LPTSTERDLNGNTQFDLSFNVLEHAAQVSGELTEDDLNLAGAIGLLLDEASLGMLLGSALPVAFNGIPVVGLNAAFLKFFALKGDAATVALIGVPELDLRVDVLQVRVNNGSFVPGPWPTLPGLLPPPVIDYVQSYPDDTHEEGDPRS
jgi:hypothetical protein